MPISGFELTGGLGGFNPPSSPDHSIVTPPTPPASWSLLCCWPPQFIFHNSSPGLYCGKIWILVKYMLWKELAMVKDCGIVQIVDWGGGTHRQLMYGKGWETFTMPLLWRNMNCGQVCCWKVDNGQKLCTKCLFTMPLAIVLETKCLYSWGCSWKQNSIWFAF